MAKRTKHKTGNIVINSIKILKMVHIKNNLKKKRTLLGLFKPLWTCSLCSPPYQPLALSQALQTAASALCTPCSHDLKLSFPSALHPSLTKVSAQASERTSDPLSAMAPLLRSSPTCPVSDGLLTVCSQLTHGGRDFVVFTTTPSIVMGLNIPLEERKEI